MEPVDGAAADKGVANGVSVPAVGEVAKPPLDGAVPAKETKPDIDSKRFAAIAKKEKGLLLKQQDLKAREETIAKKMADYEAWEKTKATAKQNPLQLLEQAGLTYEDLTAFVLNDKKPTADLGVKAVKDELEAFKRQQADERAKLLEEEKARAAAEHTKIIEAYHKHCVDFVSANASQYELTKAAGAEDLIVEVVQQHFADTQRVLTEKEAADKVEAYLEKQLEKMTASKKWQERAKAQPTQKEPEKRPDSAQRTLNNGMTASTPSFVNSRAEDDRVKRALAKLGG